MFSFSYSGVSRLGNDFPFFFDGSLRPVFRAPMKPRRGSPKPQNLRATWAQAEMFVAFKLSMGFHADYLESMVEEEVGISRDTGDFDPLFLQYCLRILRNMRNAGQFSDLAENCGVQDVATGSRDGCDENRSTSRKFADLTVVSRYGKDKEIAKEIEECQCLDKETEESLQDMRNKLHREAERIWHENAAKVLQEQPDHGDDSSSGYSVSSLPRAQDMRRVGFPDVSTMTESPIPGPRHDSSHTSLTHNYHIRNRGRSHSTSPRRTVEVGCHTRRGRPSSIRPGDSVSQFEPNYTTRTGPDFPILRASSPPNTNKSNDGFSSRGSSSHVSGSHEGQCITPLHRSSAHRTSSDLSNIFKQLRVGDDHPHRSSSRREEKVSQGRDERKKQFAHDFGYSRRFAVHKSARTKDQPQSVSRGWVQNESSRLGRRRSPSANSGSTVIPENSNKSRGKQNGEFVGRSRVHYDDQGQVADRDPGSRYPSDFHLRYESRHQSDLSPPRPAKNLDRRESRRREDLEISSSRAGEWVMGQEARREDHSCSRPVQPSNIPDHYEPRLRRYNADPYHRPSNFDSRIPLVYNRYNSIERGEPREEIKLRGCGGSQSPYAGAGYIQPHAETLNSTMTGYTSHLKLKKSNECGPLKRR